MRLVVEQTNAGERQDHVVFVAGLDDVVVADGTARLRNILHAAAVRALDVVAEREKGVRTQRYAAQGIQPGALFRTGQRVRFGGEVFLPLAVRQNIQIVVGPKITNFCLF